MPKSLYATFDDENDGTKGVVSGEKNEPVLESLYQKGYVYKGLPLEVFQLILMLKAD